MNHYKKRNPNLIFTPQNPLPMELQSPRLRKEVMNDIMKEPKTYEAFLKLRVEAQEAIL